MVAMAGFSYACCLQQRKRQQQQHRTAIWEYSRARVRWLDNLFTYDIQRARVYALARFSMCAMSLSAHPPPLSLSLSLSLSLGLSTPLEAGEGYAFYGEGHAARVVRRARRRISQSRDFKGNNLVILGY